MDLSRQCARASVPKYGLGLHLFAGLFERHKLLFSFNMTIKIEQAEGRVPQDELDFFLKGNGLAGFHPRPIHRHRRHGCPFTINITSSKIPFQKLQVS